MLILACDTSTEYAVFVIGDDNNCLICSETFVHNRNLSQRFYDSLNTVLAKSQLNFADIDVLAVGVGPGSFTGVRVAVTTMKTLAQAASKKLVAVGTLATYADAALTSNAAKVAVLPSRKGEIYFQVFVPGQNPEGPASATLEAFQTVITGLKSDIILCGQTRVLDGMFTGIPRLEQNAPPALSLLQLAASSVRSNNFANALSLSPVYAAQPAISQHKSR